MERAEERLRFWLGPAKSVDDARVLLAQVLAALRSPGGIDLTTRLHRGLMEAGVEDLKAGQRVLLEAIEAFALQDSASSSPLINWSLEPKKEVRRSLEIEVLEAVIDNGVVFLRGPSGSGKTELARAIAWRSEVELLFTGGVLWLDHGPEGSVEGLLSQLLAEVFPDRQSSLPGGVGLVTSALRRRPRTLIVIDDATNEGDVEVLARAAGDDHTLLATSKALEVGDLEARSIRCDRLTTEEARTLLFAGEMVASDLHATVDRITAQLGRNAYLVSAFGRQVRAIIGRQELPTNRELQDVASELLGDGEFGLSHLFGKVVERSIRLLDTSIASLLGELGRFGYLRSFPLDLVSAIWDVTPWRAAAHIAELANVGLCSWHVGSRRILELHEITHSYLTATVSSGSGTARGIEPLFDRLDALQTPSIEAIQVQIRLTTELGSDRVDRAFGAASIGRYMDAGGSARDFLSIGSEVAREILLRRRPSDAVAAALALCHLSEVMWRAPAPLLVANEPSVADSLLDIDGSFNDDEWLLAVRRRLQWTRPQPDSGSLKELVKVIVQRRPSYGRDLLLAEVFAQLAAADAEACGWIPLIEIRHRSLRAETVARMAAAAATTNSTVARACLGKFSLHPADRTLHAFRGEAWAVVARHKTDGGDGDDEVTILLNKLRNELPPPLSFRALGSVASIVSMVNGRFFDEIVTELMKERSGRQHDDAAALLVQLIVETGQLHSSNVDSMLGTANRISEPRMAIESKGLLMASIGMSDESAIFDPVDSGVSPLGVEYAASILALGSSARGSDGTTRVHGHWLAVAIPAWRRMSSPDLQFLAIEVLASGPPEAHRTAVAQSMYRWDPVGDVDLDYESSISRIQRARSTRVVRREAASLASKRRLDSRSLGVAGAALALEPFGRIADQAVELSVSFAADATWVYPSEMVILYLEHAGVRKRIAEGLKERLDGEIRHAEEIGDSYWFADPTFHGLGTGPGLLLILLAVAEAIGLEAVDPLRRRAADVALLIRENPEYDEIYRSILLASVAAPLGGVDSRLSAELANQAVDTVLVYGWAEASAIADVAVSLCFTHGANAVHLVESARALDVIGWEQVLVKVVCSAAKVLHSSPIRPMAERMMLEMSNPVLRAQVASTLWATSGNAQPPVDELIVGSALGAGSAKLQAIALAATEPNSRFAAMLSDSICRAWRAIGLPD